MITYNLMRRYTVVFENCQSMDNSGTGYHEGLHPYVHMYAYNKSQIREQFKDEPILEINLDEGE